MIHGKRRHIDTGQSGHYSSEISHPAARPMKRVLTSNNQSNTLLVELILAI